MHVHPALKTMSKTQLERLYKRIMERIDRIYGYQPFGYDWITLRMCTPEWADALVMVHRAYHAKD